MTLKPHQTAILTAFAVAAASTVIPFVGRLFLPVMLLNTHIHELCHALVAWSTGAEVSSIHIVGDGNGLTYISGGNLVLEGSAGYVGSSIVGALVIFFSRTPNAAKNTLRVLAAALGFSVIVLVRGDLIGVLSGIGWVAALAGLSFIRGVSVMLAAQILGLMQCLNAVQALYVLLRISAFSEGQSDAMILQSSTGIPAMIWALGWCGFSLALMAFTLQRAWVRPVGARTPGTASR